MKQRKLSPRKIKLMALCGIAALCLCLTGCYIPPDDLSEEVGTNNFPFPTQKVTDKPTDAPTHAPTVPQQGGLNTPAGTYNWNDYITTPGPSTGVQQPGIITTGQPGTTAGVIVATTATPAPTSMKLGTTGDAVRSVQQRLKQLGYYTGSVDGDFGEGTEAAVKAFQERHNLYVDGKVGEQTLAKLNSPSALQALTQTSKPSATATPNVSNARYLTIGSSGNDVRQLQARLISLGWLAGTADGNFGAATEKAVKAFQKRAGLWDDGIAGPDTQKEIYSSSAPKTSSPQASVGKLEVGSEGTAVRLLQTRLRELDYLKVSPDGSYGEATKAAVIAFQKNNGLTADGVAGAATLNKLYSSSAVSASVGATGNGNSSTNDPADTTVSSTGYTTLREGDEGDAVRKLQQALKNKGLYKGSVDGSYGAGTKEAVKEFQSRNYLRVDGVAGPQTQRALYNTSTSSSYVTLRPGDEGKAVTNLQYTLYELGYFDGKINGIYNSLTENAVRDFQIRNKLTPVDGIAGNATLQKLYSSSALPAAADKPEYETLRQGDDGLAVLEMQEALKQLGYLGSVTAVYDDATYWAVKSFQERNGLSSDGVAGNETLKKLYSDSAKSAY